MAERELPNLYQIIASDPVVRAEVATFNSQPAIFMSGQAFEGADFPFVVVNSPFISPFDTKTQLGRSCSIDIRCYESKRDSNPDKANKLAERIRFLFHRKPIALTGYKLVQSEVQGPIPVDTDEVFGRVITARLLLQDS